MAIKYKFVKEEIKKKIDRLKNDPLSKEEEAIVSTIEKYVDDEIRKQFTEMNSEVSIDMGIYNFVYDPYAKSVYNPGIVSWRKIALQKELENRFKLAGWKTYIEYGEDDGPNRPGIDYWVLSGK